MTIPTPVKGHAMSTTAKVPPAKLARVVERIRHHLYRLHQRLTPAPAAMIEMILAGWTSQAITVAAQLGVADALADGPLPIDELAARVDADADALRRLLRALISRGVFRHRRDGRYELNSIADTLRSDAPASMTSAARFYGSAEQRERWTLLVDSVRTGTSVVPALRGKSSFDYFAENPELAELFNQTMTSVSELTDATVVAGYDFSAYPTIVDVGGGHGPLLATILTAAPASRGVLYDLHRVVANAPNLLRENNVADRNVRAEAGPRATLLLVEFVIPEHNRDFPGKWVDLEMLLNLGARERTAAEYKDLLSQAGFRMTRVVQTASPLSVVEARAA